MTTFHLEIDSPDGPEPLVITPERLFNLGSATVAQASAVAHQQEVADVGVRIAFDIPAPRVYPMAVTSVTTDDAVGVHHSRTSGEAELVLLVQDGELFLGVGSDHTDRELEQISIIWSKQYAASVLGRRVWRWSDVEADWEALILASTLDGVPYQSSPAAVFLAPPMVLNELATRVRQLPSSYVVFCGTYVTLDTTVRFGTQWGVSLTNQRTGAELGLSYRTIDLFDDVEPASRVPLRSGAA